MWKIPGLFFIFIMLVTGCGQTGQSNLLQQNQVSIILKAEQIALSQPALVQKETVYVSSDDLANLPGLKVSYDQNTGEITATGKDVTFPMKVGQPFKEGDKNGPKPFLEKGVLYLPLCDTVSRLGYKATEEKSQNGTFAVTLEKLWQDAYDAWKPFSAKELKAAEAALAAGVTITDPANDWAPISEGTQPDGRMDNGNPYPISFTDVKSMTFGADSQYLYLKVELYDIIPTKVVYWQNTEFNKEDFIHSFSCNFGLSHFLNRNTGKADGGLMQLGVSYVEGDPRDNLVNPKFLNPPVVAISNFATVTGNKDKNNEDTYNVSNGDGRTGGGAGKNYVIGAFPLSNFGLQFGDVIEFDFSMETGSKLFHHECVDVILDCGYKAGETIRYKLGANTYESLGPPANMLPLTPTKN
jgi:hypothetical protein